jgi:hypothetical protein
MPWFLHAFLILLEGLIWLGGICSVLVFIGLVVQFFVDPQK